jgi:hypothetical protein
MGAASELGRADLGVEEGAAQRGQQQRQYNASTGTEMLTGIERDQAARRERNALNRQGIQQSNQAVKYGQGMGVQQAKTRGAQTVADAKRQDAQEARGWMNQQQQQAAAEEGREYDRQQNVWQQQAGQQQQTTQQQAAKDAQPKGWEKGIGLAMGAVGAAIPAVGMAQNIGKMAMKKSAPAVGYGIGAWDS